MSDITARLELAIADDAVELCHEARAEIERLTENYNVMLEECNDHINANRTLRERMKKALVAFHMAVTYASAGRVDDAIDVIGVAQREIEESR